MKRWMIGALLCAALTGCTNGTPVTGPAPTVATTTPAPQPTVASVPTAAASGTEATSVAIEPTIAPISQAEPKSLVSDASVVPQIISNLSFEVSGVVAEVLVSEGDIVEAGTPLIQLSPEGLSLQVNEAEAALEQARAAYMRLNADAAPQDIAAARARINQAKAELGVLKAGPTTYDVQRGQARLDNARADLEDERDRLSTQKSDAELRMQKAANDVRDRQAELDVIFWENQGQSSDDISTEGRAREDQARRALDNAEKDLERAVLEYEQTKLNEINGLATAETLVREAQSNLDAILREPTAAELAAAHTKIADAEAALARLLGRERARSPEAAANLAQAAARISEAEIMLRQAQLNLSKSTLIAPISGTVATLSVEPGQVVRNNDIVAVIADLNNWQLQTDDVTEIEVVNIKVGDSVAITFAALPDLQLDGTVDSISTIGKSDQGDILYTVVVKSEQWDPRLRWNMTALISFMMP
jgi:HlyD family secretion protein